MRTPGQFPVIVEKSDQAKPDRDAEHDPHIRVSHIGPQDRRYGQSAENKEAAHRRRPFLADQVALRPVLANRLAFALHRSEPSDQVRAKDETDQQRGDDRPTRAERDIAKDIEGAELIGERKKEQIKHSSMFLTAAADRQPPSKVRRLQTRSLAITL